MNPFLEHWSLLSKKMQEDFAAASKRPWRHFCRALSVAGLPECTLGLNHRGAHVFGYVETDALLDRCAVMLRAAKRRRPKRLTP